MYHTFEIKTNESKNSRSSLDHHLCNHRFFENCSEINFKLRNFHFQNNIPFDFQKVRKGYATHSKTFNGEVQTLILWNDSLINSDEFLKISKKSFPTFLNILQKAIREYKIDQVII